MNTRTEVSQERLTSVFLQVLQSLGRTLLAHPRTPSDVELFGLSTDLSAYGRFPRQVEHTYLSKHPTSH